MTPLVSIVIPTFNRARLLPRAIASVLQQSEGDWELIVIDDGSTDDTPEVLRRYAACIGKRFRWTRQTNRGASAARNVGIGLARGKYIAFLDSDDEFLPAKLSRQLELFDRYPELGFVYSDYAFVDVDGERHDSVFDELTPQARAMPARCIGGALYHCDGQLFDWLLRGYFIATIVGMVRRDVLGEHLRFPESLSYAEEWLFYLRVSRACACGFVDEPLCLHHHVAGSLARTDKHRNNRRYLDLLCAIRAAFPDLTRAQALSVRAMIADATLQTGFDAYRDGQYWQAARRFLVAWGESPNWRALRYAGDAAVRHWLPGRPVENRSAAP